jgi:nitroimidazol reductase NimA-like FMN-containing flavoprotein (pyridoxamine 5'-phosphate oxidase superfamily)
MSVDNLVRDRNGLEILNRQECLQLLASAPVGRVSVNVDALPVILPVNYALSASGQVVFAVGDGQKLRGALDNAVVAFEADAFDAETRSGWSVLVQDRAQVVPPREAGELADLDLDRWAAVEATSYIVLDTTLMSGRRITQGV